MALHQKVVRPKPKRRMVVLGSGRWSYAYVIRIHRNDGGLDCHWRFLRADSKLQAEEYVRLCRDRRLKQRRYRDGQMPRSSSFSVYRALTQFPMRKRQTRNRSNEAGIWGMFA